LWTIIQPNMPVNSRRFKHPGRKRVPDRACLTGILFVRLTGIQWQMLPQEMGRGCGMTSWRRLRDWQAAGDEFNGGADQAADPLSAVCLSQQRAGRAGW
jgi:transposase